MAWDDEMVIIARVMIQDADTPYKYTDDRVQQLILVAAQLCQTENIFNQIYTISVSDYILTPDPTIVPRDDAFINLTLLKAACSLARSGLIKTAPQAIAVKEGNYSFDTKGVAMALQAAATTWCQAYNDARWEYMYQNITPGEAIMGPYRLYATAIGSRGGPMPIYGEGAVPFRYYRP